MGFLYVKMIDEMLPKDAILTDHAIPKPKVINSPTLQHGCARRGIEIYINKKEKQKSKETFLSHY